MIKILSSKIENGSIKITIDRVGRNEFVYDDDKFNNKAELIAEIEASIEKEERLKAEKDLKVNTLKSELGI